MLHKENDNINKPKCPSHHMFLLDIAHYMSYSKDDRTHKHSLDN